MNKYKVYETIINRRSIRQFKQSPVQLEILEKLVNTARLAPSSGNLQPWEYIIVSEKNLVNEVFSTLKWAGYIVPKGNPRDGQRPVAYIVVLVNTKTAGSNYRSDTGAAIENMILTALEEGIGSCWIGSIDRPKLSKMLGIPERLEVDSILALGYPDETPVAEDMMDSIKYWKDNKGKLHVPKRKLENIVHYNKY